MYLAGYSIDNLSLMALTISTGFVVDDAIVVIENITRYVEHGMQPFQAALKGAQEIGFTVLTISLSLVAVFIPLLMMGGMVGRLFREFAVTLSVAIFVSMVISLTTTPMMCAYLLREEKEHGWLYNKSENVFTWIVNLYGRTLSVVLRHPALTLLSLLATVALTVYLYIHTPKGFFPQQDTGRLNGSIQADQDTSFQAMDETLKEMVGIIDTDPGIDTVNAFTGGTNTARMFISLKPLNERKITADQIIQRLRPRLAKIPGATLYLQAVQDLRVGGRSSNAQYQYTMQADSLSDLTTYAPRMLNELKQIRIITDVNSDQQDRGLQAMVDYDRTTAARFNISSQLIDNVLYDAFGQRQVSTMYSSLNQYHVVMEAAPEYWQNPNTLHNVYVSSPSGNEVPLSAIAKNATATAPLSVNHQGLFPAITMSFNLQPGAALGDAVTAIAAAGKKIGLPATIQTGFAGTAQAYQDSLASEPLLIATALATVYIVLGMLYESYIHPITILSTLPSAGVGALLALELTRTDLSVIAIIGIILLIGIVKKNAILMIDFAIAAERNEGQELARCDFRSLPAAIPANSDDHHGGAAGRAAPGVGDGNRIGAAAAARNHHHRRPAVQPDADALYDAGGLSLLRPPAAMAGRAAGAAASSDWGRTAGLGGLKTEMLNLSERHLRMRNQIIYSTLAGGLLLLSSCREVGPNYTRPPVAPVPQAFKEKPPDGWTEAQPSDTALKGKWWEIYNDPQLNALEDEVDISNQNVLAAEGQYRAARAMVQIARSALFPTVTVGPAVNGGQGGANAAPNLGVFGVFQIPFDVSYQVDLWGSIRRNIRANAETAQATEAQLENAKLTYQADLAQDYFQLRGTDGDVALLQSTVDSYTDFLKLTQARHDSGIASGADVAQAETQLDSAKEQLIDLGVARAQYEHAIAVLVGKPPAELSIEQRALKGEPPQVPVAMPSTLLERRPDIAASERQMAELNEQIGIADAAFYPSLTLSAGAGPGQFELHQTVYLGVPFLDVGRHHVGNFVRRRKTARAGECRESEFRCGHGELPPDHIERLPTSGG